MAAGRFPEQHTGRCLCGGVRFEADGAPLWVAHCHCDSCRRATASAVATFVCFDDDRVRWTAGERRLFNSSPGVTRSFCGTCGTPLAYQAERWPGEIHIHLCALDRPELYPPQVHVFTAERLPWLHIADDARRYRTLGGDN